MSGTAVKLDKDGVAAVVNTAPVSTPQVLAELKKDPELKSIADALGGWVERVRTPTYPQGGRKPRVGGLIDRDRWLTPSSSFEQMKLGREALRDDIVGTAADGTEAFALSKVAIYCEDPDAEDVWNQWAGDINLDDVLRKAWNILFTDSQFCAVTWWDRRSYKVRGTTEAGRERRKSFDNMLVPIGITYLDTTKVTPVGNMMFGQEQLAYIPTPDEAYRIDRVLFERDNPGATPLTAAGFMRHNGQIRRIPDRRMLPALGTGFRDTIPDTLDALELDDPLIRQLFIGRYRPDMEEARLLQEDGVDVTNLFLMRPDMAFRHCLTRPDYERFSRIRLESTFELLDLKSQLRQIDRVVLIGGSSFIVLITKGSDKIPAEQAEIDALRSQAFTLATVPVIVGDHRLKVEIITPKQDHTLDRTKWDTLDVRIFSRVWSTFVPTGADRDDPLKTAKIIAKNLESRRLMLRRSIEREVIDRMRRYNADQLKDRAKLIFTPATISLAFDGAWASFLMDLRASNEISRNTILGQFDLDQADEARQRLRESKYTDPIFQTQDPHGTPNPMNENGNDPYNGPGGAQARQRAAGRAAKGGGLPNDGSGRGQAPRRAGHRANPDTPREAAKALYDMDRNELVDMATELEIPGRHRMRKPKLIKAIRAAQLGIEEDELEDDDIDG